MGDITEILQRWRAGSRDAEDELFAMVLPHLRQLARYLMKGERKGHSLQPTELVNQIYFRLVAAKDRDWQSRQHFFAIAGRTMRRYLIDHARARPASDLVALEELEGVLPARDSEIELALTIDRLLEGLAEVKPEWCTLVELKFFLGLTDDEAAEAMGLKLRSMQRMWHEARQWLFERAGSQGARQSAG
jgi:RNA polymerase sigma factor (TIGR02999 family)